MVRVSIGNIVRRVVFPIDSGNHNTYISIFSAAAYKRGYKILQPIGGAVELTEAGKFVVQERFGATDFHMNQEGGCDARFRIEDSCVDDVLDFFGRRDHRFFEIDPRRELIEELAGVELKGGILPEILPVLTLEEAESVNLEFVGTIIQPFSDGLGTSSLATPGMPNRRLFHRFDMVVSADVYRKIKRSEAIRLLSSEEVASTEGGQHKGVTVGGIDLADNLIL